MIRSIFLGCLLFVGLYASAESKIQNPEIGFHYRAGITYDDHGFDDFKANVNDPATATNVSLEYADLHFSGRANEAVSYNFSVNLLAEDREKLEDASVEWSGLDLFSLSAGRQRVNQGGFATRSNPFDSIAPISMYDDNLPFNHFEPMIGLHLKLAGKLSIQILNDVNRQDHLVLAPDNTKSCENCYKNDSSKGPTATIEWLGDFGEWHPLLGFGSYDLNKSSFFVLGVKGKAAGLDIEADYTADNRKYFQIDPITGDRDGEEASDSLTSYEIGLSYKMSGFTPWLEYTSFERKLGDIDSSARKDPKGNAARSLGSDVDLSDNAKSMSVGANCNVFGNGYTPYVAVIAQKANFLNSKDSTSSPEELTNLKIKFGVFGSF